MFSAIIPVYNKARTLNRAIQSVLKQSCTDWELIVVNDGSTDNFDEAIRSFETDARIRVIRQKNGGVSVARNAGIALAREPYLAFLDADDEWMPNHLSFIKEMIEDEPGAGIYATALRVLSANGTFFETKDCFTKEGIHREKDLFAYMKKNAGKHAINIIASVESRELVAKYGAFEPGTAKGEDTDFTMRLAAHCDVVLSNVATAIYHREDSTASKNGVLTLDWRFEQREQEIMADESIPPEKRANILLSINRYRIHACRHFLMEGNRKRAKEVFATIDKTPYLERARILTRLMMAVPAPLLRIAYNIKNR